MSPLARRIVARLVLAAGAAALVTLMMRDCDRRTSGLTVVIDPRPVGDAIRSIRVDVAEGNTTLGTTERQFLPGEIRKPVTLTVPAPHGNAELRVELGTSAGHRRVKRILVVTPGSTVTLSIDGLEPVSPP